MAGSFWEYLQRTLGGGPPPPMPPMPDLIEPTPPIVRLPAIPTDGLSPEIEALLQKYGPKEAAFPYELLRRAVYRESSFNPKSVSRSGAQGLMQLMPVVQKQYGVTDPFDPEQNIRAGAQYLNDLYERFGNRRLALAAYNAGPTRVRKSKGIPNIKETQDYVRYVMGY